MAMTRAESLAVARAARSVKAAARKQGPVTLTDEAERREILALRSELGVALGKNFGASGMNLNLGDIQEENVPELKTLSGRTEIYDRMGNDAAVYAQVNTVVMSIISGVRWSVEGGKKEHQDFVRANILREGPRKYWMARSWIDFMGEVCSSLDYGFALFGKSWRIVGDKQVYDDLKWLHPRSIRDDNGWEMDDQDNLLAVHRTFKDGTGQMVSDQRIESKDLFLVRWNGRGPNWEGRAFIRSMYKEWKLAELALKIWLIHLQNCGVGIPMAKLSGLGGPKERDTLVEILKSLRGGSKERAFIVIEKEEDIKYLTSDGQVADAGAVMETLARRIAGAGGQEAFQQGSTDSGSRAAASALLTPFLMKVDAARIIFQNIINHGVANLVGLVEEEVYNNFGEVDECPQIVGSRVSPTEQLDNIPHVLDAIQKGGMAPHLKYNNEIARRLGWPTLTEEEFAASMSSRVGQPGGGPGRPPEIGPKDNPQDPRDDTAGRRFGLQEGQPRRPLGEIPPMRKGVSWPWLASTPN